MIRVAFRGLLARTRRLIMTSLAIAIGVAFIVGTMSLTDLLTRSVNDLISAAYQDYAVVVRSDQAQDNPFSSIPLRPPIAASVLGPISAVDGVADAQGIVQTTPAMLDKQGKRISAFGPPILAYNWTSNDRLNGGRITSGRAPERAGEMALDFKTANEFGFVIGDPFTMQFTKASATLTIVGIGGIGADGTKSSGGRIALMDTAQLQDLSEQSDQFTYIAVERRADVSQEELTARVSQVIPNGTEAKTGKQFIAENQQQVGRLIDIVGTFVQFFGYVSVFVAAFIIYNTFSILVAQRTQELALLRAVGASRGQILGSVVLEAAAVGLAATVIGIGLGAALATGLKGALGSFISLPAGIPRLTPISLLTAFGVGMVATIGSALIPAFRSTSVPPIAAIGGVQIDRSGLSLSRKILGPLLLVGGAAAIVMGVKADTPSLFAIGAGAAALFIGLAAAGPVAAGGIARFLGRPLPAMMGVTGRLATENAARNPKRTTITAVTLTIGVGLVAIITILAASVKGSFGDTFGGQIKADLVVDAGGFGGTGLAPDVAEAVRAVPGVDVVTSNRFSSARVLNSKLGLDVAAKYVNGGPLTDRGVTGLTGPPGEDAFILGIDPSSFFKIVSLGTMEPSGAQLAKGTILVSKTEADKNGWTTGTDVRMWFADVGDRAYRIAGVFDQPVFRSGYFLSFDDFNEVAPVPFRVDNALYVKLAPGTDVTATRRAVEAVVVPIAPAATVADLGTYVREQTDQLNSFILVIYVLLALAVVIAVVGIGNTLALSILERTREIGMLRAVGMVRSQLKQSIRWESAVIAAFGSVLGIAVGTAIAVAVISALADRGINLHIPPGQLALILLVGVVSGVITAILPARRGAQIDVLSAIGSV